MDQYKQNLCLEHFGDDCINEEDILRCITADEWEYDYEYKLNADGKLHSRYLEEFGCYEPAIIYKDRYRIYLYWLFDGEIKDCLHPFAIIINRENNCIYTVRYYSLERIQQHQPIHLTYWSTGKTKNATYNGFLQYENCIPIIDDSNILFRYTSLAPAPYDKLDMEQYVAIAQDVICPLWSDEFASDNEFIKFKFED